MDMNRRGFFSALGVSLVFAPAIVRAASLMPVRKIILPTPAILVTLERGMEWFDDTESGVFAYATQGDYDKQIEDIVSRAPILKPSMTGELLQELFLEAIAERRGMA